MEELKKNYMRRYVEKKKHKNTNLARVKDIAKAFLYTDIKSTKIEFVASHPFTNTWHTFLPNEIGVVDLHDEVCAYKWRKSLEGFIEQGDLLGIFSLMNKAYLLTFLKHTFDYISDLDLGRILSRYWQSIEQISSDNNVKSNDIRKFFKTANKYTLMNEEELKAFERLDSYVEVYRGVTSYNRKRKNAFSWTTDKETAQWFANRFGTGTGEVWTITVPKKRILCLFEGREKELVVDLYGYKEEYKVERV